MIAVIGIIMMFLGLLEQFLINESRIVASCIVFILIGISFIIKKYKLEIFDWMQKLIFVIGALHIIGIIFKYWIVYTGFGVILALIGIVLSVLGCIQVIQKKRSKGILVSVIAFVVFLPTAVILFTTFFPKQSMGIIKKMSFDNPNVTEAQYSQVTLDNGARLVSNICYDETYPNGFLDVYYTKNPKQEATATLIMIHGGGYIWGDKSSGDPNAGEFDMSNSFIYRALNNGYNVVALNYCLAPEYIYPTSIIQLNNGLKYLKDNAAQLNINMEKVFLLGGSAGGNLAGVMANIQTNEEYANQMNITPALDKDTVRGVLFESALFDNSQYGVTHDISIDYLFYQLGRIYLNTNDLKYDKQKVTLSNVTDNVTATFPPSFISDGNSGSFFEQAFEMNSKLIELGVDVQFVYYPKSIAKLGHGYEESGSKYADITQQRMIEFMEKYDN